MKFARHLAAVLLTVAVTVDLVRTVLIEAALIAVVVAIDAVRRRQRRARRAVTRSGGSANS